MAEGSRFSAHMSEPSFQLLVNSVTDYAIYMLDPDGYVISWNAGARRFKGYEADEIIGCHFSRFFTPEDRAAGLPQKALRIAAEEGKFEAEGVRVRKDGSTYWAHVVLDPVRDDAGQLVGFAKITRDITAQKEAERALFESERQFRTLIQGVRDYAIYMLDTSGRITNWNTGAEAIKGYRASEIIGEHFSRFYTPEDRQAGEPERALRTALAEGKYENEAYRVRKDGSRFWASVVIDPIYDEDGRHIGFAKITRDISERKETERELEEARAALMQSQKLQALGELTGGIAHDFNNLMTVIRGSADFLRRSDLSAERRDQYLNAIVETSDRATVLVSHLLAFGRRQPLKPEPMDLNIRIDALGEVLSRTLGGQIEVVLDLAPSLWLAEVDATHLETALLNAAINARDAMPEGGRLTISTRNVVDAAGDMVCVSLADTGEGMPPEVLDRAFEPFFTTKPIGKGTGLGLSQIHGFAAQTGGRTEISSRPGEGTTISLFLPRSHKPLAQARERRRGPARRRGLNILLVEDNELVRDFAKQLLADLDHKVVAAETADDALRLLKSHHFDVLFSDVVMPGRSGLELARTAHRLYPGLPVLLASGYSKEILGGASREFEILQKPYDVEMLDSALNATIEAAKREAR